jgi:hypothetical protein
LTKTVTIGDEVYERLMRVGRAKASAASSRGYWPGVDPQETLMRLRGCVEFEDKEKMIPELKPPRA